MSNPIEKVHDWRQSQAVSLASACFTLAGLILSPLLVAVFDAQARIQAWQLCLYLLGALAAAVSGVLWHLRARRLQAQFQREVETAQAAAAARASGAVRW